MRRLVLYGPLAAQLAAGDSEYHSGGYAELTKLVLVPDAKR